MNMNETLVCLLYRLGLSAKYVGFHCIVSAVEIAMETPQSLTMVTKWLYPQIARQMGTNWKAVERNIRSAINIIWRNNPEELQKISNSCMEKRPSAAQFISILVSYMTFQEN